MRGVGHVAGQATTRHHTASCLLSSMLNPAQIAPVITITQWKSPIAKKTGKQLKKERRCHGTVRARLEIWDGAEAQPWMLLLPQGMKSQHRMGKEEVPEARWKTPS